MGTVSRVLNNSTSVSEETRQKVLEVIERLNFRPSPVARQLSTGGKSYGLGIIVPFFTRPAFVARLEGIEQVVAQSSYDLVLYNVETPAQRESLFKRVPYERRVDGLIIIALYPTDEHVEHFKRCGMPVVLVDAHHRDLASVSIDDRDGGRQAVQHLVKLGHKRIAYISDDLDTPFGFRASALRLKGYHEVLERHNVPIREEYKRYGEYGRHVAHRLMRELLALPDPPTAVFASSDTQALGVIEAIQQEGLRCPEDISVVGYDNIEVAAYAGLTTIDQPFYQSGVEGVNILMDMIEAGALEQESLVMPVSLIERATTGPPPRR
mgnify:CR=1 FL=1